MLVRSLRNDGRPLRALNPVQREAIQKFREKLRSGEYSLVEVPCLCGTGADSAEIVGEKDRYGLPVTTLLCRRCGLLWTTPRMTDSALKRFYEIDYRLIYSGWHESTDAFFAAQAEFGQRVLNAVKPYLPKSGKVTVYDIGCAAGGALLPFRTAGFDVAGCDLSVSAMAVGLSKGLDLRVGPPAVLFGRGPADLAIASQVLEHIPEPHRYVCEIATLLKPNGLLYVGVPGVLRSYEEYGLMGRYLQNAHLHHFSLGTLTRMMELNGFKLVEGTEEVAAIYRLHSRIAAPVGSVPDQIAADEIRGYIRRHESLSRRVLRGVLLTRDRLAYLTSVARAGNLRTEIGRRFGRRFERED